jgi:hybrid cluster-associated redox disulfide protein
MPAPKLTYDPDMPLSDLMVRWPETVAVFEAYDMLCVACLVGPFHTVADACQEHNVDPAAFALALEAAIKVPRDPH